jgi:type IV secretory pathway VirB10-like protein
MIALIRKLKSIAIAMVALSVFVMFTISSCGSKKQDTTSEESATEQVEESTSDEHPGGEHPSSEGEEHPSDSAAMESEHPSSDDNGSEHPN